MYQSETTTKHNGPKVTLSRILLCVNDQCCPYSFHSLTILSIYYGNEQFSSQMCKCIDN